MKKFLLAFVTGVLLLFAGCSSDSDYIETVKNITFDTGERVEDIVVENIKVGEFYNLNGENVMNPFNAVIVTALPKEKVVEKFKELNIKMPNVAPENIKWEVEGETSTGKVILASKGNVVVKLETIDNGDYVEIYDTDIKTYINNKLISDEMKIPALFYNAGVEAGYDVK